ncbi:hypothetical protein GLP37_21485 [Photobacterium phosphoreum]|uniref:hypothetical protein n=1 Tax=Photobacterium phosphoreum TaxID=659 RepID=UPI001E4652C2|nr:hypothetical protein [Photobacterium phosphoreum]MCD9504738.1 hypothetical protein [Photobacterium phosphoreum]
MQNISLDVQLCRGLVTAIRSDLDEQTTECLVTLLAEKLAVIDSALVSKELEHRGLRIA